MHYHISKYIDHTYLKAEATKFEIEKLCNEAKEYQFYSVCVNPYWVKYCFSLLQNTNVKVCTVIGFPLGATSKETKVFETKEAVQNGATEVDMVLNIGALKSGDIYLVEEEIKAIVEVAKPNVLVKVILETALLTDEEKIIACEISKRAGADFVKTSTGFSSKGATVEDITLMRKIVGNDMGVKASGSVNTLEKINDMINAGANRIGTSSGVFVLNHKTAEDDY